MVTTHEDMGSIYQNAKRLEAHGDFKKIEGRFRYKWNLTTENIELVLEDSVFRKNIQGKQALEAEYRSNPGVLRDLGQLQNTAQVLPECSEERFIAFYPFLPYQIHLIPEIVKSLRSKGGRGEQLWIHPHTDRYHAGCAEGRKEGLLKSPNWPVGFIR